MFITKFVYLNFVFGFSTSQDISHFLCADVYQRNLVNQAAEDWVIATAALSSLETEQLARGNVKSLMSFQTGEFKKEISSLKESLASANKLTEDQKQQTVLFENERNELRKQLIEQKEEYESSRLLKQKELDDVTLKLAEAKSCVDAAKKEQLVEFGQPIRYMEDDLVSRVGSLLPSDVNVDVLHLDIVGLYPKMVADREKRLEDELERERDEGGL